MPIDHINKSIFIHIPKCAGNSIEKFFGLQNEKCFWHPNHRDIEIDGVLYNPQHIISKHLKSFPEIAQYYDTYFKFSFIRNPYDRVISGYFHRHNNGIKKGNIKILDYDYFKQDIFKFYSKIDIDHKLSQYDYLYENNKLCVDFIGRVENIDKDMRKLQKILNISSDKVLEKHNSFSHNYKNKNKYLTPEIKEFIYSIFTIDFETFNYQR